MTVILKLHYRISMIKRLFADKETSCISVIFLILLVLGTAILLILFQPHHRLYQLDAQTSHIDLDFSESSQNRWLISEFQLCTTNDINEIDLFSEDSVEGDSCTTSIEPTDKDRVLKIYSGTKAAIEWSDIDGLRVSLSNTKSVGEIEDLQDNKKLLGKKVLLHRKPTITPLNLTFVAAAYIGAEAKLGQNAILQKGVIKVFEKAKYVFNSRYLIGDISLSMGDVASFYKMDGASEPMSIKGFLNIPSSKLDPMGINITAYAGAEINGNVTIRRFGTQGIEFSPTLWKRIEADPTLSLLLTLFGMLLIVLELASLGFNHSAKVHDRLSHKKFKKRNYY